ncbi:MAG TPA: phosphoribosyltransferase family protein [Ferruginibacter sp.]|jgi:pyrimidine operon attenuation protein/uracil phosphoribosyltransferase|nr:phosphoribosyltransferase [Bacteroidota bacterium]MCC6692404.1 phosphoribosyltransferase [Chitinophagaceae bacterium]HMU24322.1 phosphoribosyltransferase family protein [Ferruginibacter sp.]HRD43497.1 phosphoribosyltransferase family protein [Ferruginibacter sp.]
MILDQETAAKKIYRMAMEIAERHYNQKEIVLIGIKENGFFIAQKISTCLAENFKGAIFTLSLSMNKKDPGEIKLSDPTDLKQKCVILIDDVANSGRTMSFALKLLLGFSPAEIQTLALVERTHKLFPVAVDYVGISVSSGRNEYIEVLIEKGEVQGAVLKS